MFTVIETPEFAVWADKVWSNAERETFIDWISENPLAGDVIPGTGGGLRKVRWTRQGSGKRGGSRVIYFNRLQSGEIVLLIVYSKAKFDDLSAELLTQIKERFDGKTKH
jgi:mRNA-degrading endonuclease RelE of RelBE toxin-antitoxin system